MQRFRRSGFVVALLALLANSACYAYLPVGSAPPHPARGVRFQLTEAGTTDLAKYLGPNVIEVSGRLTDVRSSGELVVAPEWVKTSNGISQPWSGEGSLEVPRHYLRSLDERTFNQRKTILASVTVTAGLIAIAAMALKSGGAHGGSGPDGTTPVAR